MITLLFWTCVALVVFFPLTGRIKAAVSIVGVALLLVLWILMLFPESVR